MTEDKLAVIGQNQEKALALIREVRRSIATIDSAAEAAHEADRMKILGDILKKVGAEYSIQNEAAETRCELVARAGLLLPDAGHGGDRKSSNYVLLDPVLPAMRASRYRQVARVPPDDREGYYVKQLAGTRDITIAGLLAYWRKLQEQFRDIELPEGKYRTIVIDPPWPIKKILRDKAPEQVDMDYGVSSLAQIADMKVADMVPDDGACHLYLWTTQKYLPAALNMVKAWGFTYIFTMTWLKPGGFQPFGLPQYNTEFVVFGRKGGLDFEDTKAFFTGFTAPRGRHSEKPDEFYSVVARVSPAPRINLFARKQREGFTGWGDEVK